MKHLSIWAHRHHWPARFLMTTVWITLFFLAIISGASLMKQNILLSPAVFSTLVVVFLLVVLFYPFRQQRKTIKASLYYRWQKSCDFLLAFCSFGMVLFAANQPGILFQQNGSLYAATTSPVSLPKDSSAKKFLPIKEFSKKMYDADGKLLKWKEQKNMLKQQVKAIKSSPGMSKAGKTMLTILAVLAALGLLLLVTALACNLACNGSGAAAVLVGAAGAGLVVFLLVLTIRAIYGKKKRKKINEEIKQTAPGE